MTTPNGPFDAPVDSADPGMGRPIVALVMVFIVGIACVGLIYAVGEPIDPTTIVAADGSAQVDTEANAAGKTDTSKTPTHTTTPPAQAYVSPGGTNPFPNYGEPKAPPIPPTQLIDEQTFDAPPPQASTLPDPEGPVPWDEAHKYLDRVITVKGTIVDTNNIGNICFLNYDSDWHDKFYIAMFQEAFELLPDPPEEHYLNKTLLVTGKVTLHKDRPQIEVRDVSQIEVVD